MGFRLFTANGGARDYAGTWADDVLKIVLQSNQNDFAPFPTEALNFANFTTLELNALTAVNVTGLRGGVDGRPVTLLNTSANNITLVQESGLSSAANRFAFAFTLAQNQAIRIQWNATVSRWFFLGVSSSGGAPVNAQYVVMAADATLTDERILTAGANITIVDSGAGLPVTISATAGGAPVGAPYVVVSLDATLTAERRLQAGAGLSLVDGGANADITLSLAATPAPVNASYLVVGLDATLTNERNFVAGSGLSSVDSGVNAPFTVSVANNGITDAMLRQGIACSVIGRSANSLGNVADIQAANDNEFLQRVSGVLGFVAFERDNNVLAMQVYGS